MKKSLGIVFISVACLVLIYAGGAIATQQSMKVFQPKYNFEFNVYRTEDMQANWYKTYDDYYVSKDINNNWIYGKQSPQGITATNILVGSVNPKEVKELAPVVAPVYIPPESQGVRTETTLTAPMSDEDFLELCGKGTAEEIEIALQNGANINAKQLNGYTPLMFAVTMNHGRLGIIPVLLKYGADINAQTQDGYTTLMLASVSSSPNPEVVAELIRSGADINAQTPYGYTALMLSASIRSPNPEVVAELIRNGADIKLKTYQGDTALDLANHARRRDGAKIANNAEVIEMLRNPQKVKYGAKPSSSKRR